MWQRAPEWDRYNAAAMPACPDVDVAIIGAGAAGLATAIFAKRRSPALRVRVLDGARSPGAKILVSGGGRCNVTNAAVTNADFNGGRPATVKQVLRALPVPATIAFFRELGVTLHEEERGKLFPDSHRSRDVLDALVRELERLGIELRAGHRVMTVSRVDAGFAIESSQGPLTSRAIVLATGGLALPKTGSDGAGYGFAQQLGHTLVPTTPALVPLVAAAEAPRQFHARVSGVSQPVRLTVRAGDTPIARIDGPLLWTHFGISGPAALDASRHWLRAELDGRSASLVADLAPGERFETLEARWLDLARQQPRMSIARALGTMMPASVADALSSAQAIDTDTTLATLTRDTRRALLHAIAAWPIAVTGSRGYSYAEVTAGGIALDEIDPRTMASRCCPGLYLVGEILDVDGRLGGFNFQWAWSTAKVAGDALSLFA
jgi:predicted Rossmann fold flavoprotein